MPELPEVETVKRGLAPYMQGQTVEKLTLNRSSLRFSFPKNLAQKLERQNISNIERRAKFLLFHLSNGETLISHLGMSGRYVVLPPKQALEHGDVLAQGAFTHNAPRHIQHDHVIFHLNNGVKVIYNDPRRFGYMDIAPTDALHLTKHFQNLGVEPLSNELNAPYLQSHILRTKRSLKALLLDQKIIAGLGNIYVCEALYEAGFSPFLSGEEAAKDEIKIQTLISAIRRILEVAIEAGGSSLKDHRQADGQLGYFQHQFKVYDQENNPCQQPECDGIIQRKVQNGRSTFFCPICQEGKNEVHRR